MRKAALPYCTKLTVLSELYVFELLAPVKRPFFNLRNAGRNVHAFDVGEGKPVTTYSLEPLWNYNFPEIP